MTDDDSGWTRIDIAAKRQELIEVAARAHDDQLDKIASMHDILDVAQAVEDGTIEREEAKEKFNAIHRSMTPHSRVHWRAMDPRYMTRQWSVHPADVDAAELVNLRPLPPTGAAQLAAATEQSWVHTTGDPDDVEDFNKTAMYVGATDIGSVLFGMCSAQEDEEDSDAVAVANVGVALPISAAVRFRDDLNRAIRRARTLADQYTDRERDRLAAHLVERHGIESVFARAIADAAAESSRTGVPAGVVRPDGALGWVSVDADGFMDLGEVIPELKPDPVSPEEYLVATVAAEEMASEVSARLADFLSGSGDEGGAVMIGTGDILEALKGLGLEIMEADDGDV